MKKLILVLLAFLSLGFMIETPESIRERERLERTWQRDAKRVVDLGALRSFLAEEIRSRRIVGGVDITTSRLEPKWRKAGMAFQCGDWVFAMPAPQTGRFVVFWNYEEARDEEGSLIQRSITFECHRSSRKEFVVDKVEKREDEIVILQL